MTFSLKNLVNNVFGSGDEIDRILAMPITQLRLELKEAFQQKLFTQQSFDSFVERLSKVEDIASQKDIALKAAQDREVESPLDIELNTDAKQLLWAAVLTRMMTAGTEPLANSRLWKQLQQTIGVYNEGITIANIISTSLQNDEATFDWGQPGSWFYQNRKDNHMNFDMYFMLLAGFEHTRAVALHEIGHSDLSQKYPPSMQPLYDQVIKIIDPTTATPTSSDPQDPLAPKKRKAPQQMTKQEQIDLARLFKQWELRHRSWNFMEDITVDQFAINMEDRLPQDFGYSMNHAATNLRGYGEIMRGDDLKRPVKVTTDQAPEKIAADDQKHAELVKRVTTPLTPQEIQDVKAGNISVEIAQKMFKQIEGATLLAGYVKNNLFSSTAKNWERFHVFAEDINSTVDVSQLPDAKGRDAFTYLFDICAEGPDSIRLSQPDASDRFLIHPPHKNIADSYKAMVQDTNDKRNKIMEKIWDVYLKPFADVLMEEYTKNVEKRLDDMQQQKQQQKKQQQQQGQQQQKQQQSQQQNQQPGPPQQDDQQGEQEGQQQPGDGQQPGQQGMSQPGEGKGEGGPSQEKGGEPGEVQGGEPSFEPGQAGGGGDSDEPMDMDQDLGSDIEGMSETPEEGRAKQSDQEQKNGKGGGQDQDQDADAPEGSGGEEAGDDKNDQPSDDQGDDQGDGGGKGDDAEDKADADAKDGQSKQQKSGEKPGGPGWDHAPEDKNKKPQKVRDMKEKSKVDDTPMSEEQKEKMKQEAANAKPADPSALTSRNAGSGAGLDLAKLAKGNWRDFEARMIELAPIVNQLTTAYKKIRDEQKRQIMKESRDVDFMAEDGDVMARLDFDKVLQMKFLKATGQKMTPDDFKKFREDKTFMMYSTIEMVFMIDGSGSMAGAPLDAALQSAAIGYMACRKAGIDSYIVIWGDPKPFVLATPKSTLKQVGDALEGMRSRSGGGTDLAPGLVSTIESMAEHKNKNGIISGSSHILIFSDGDIYDEEASEKVLRTIAVDGKNISVDVAIVKQSYSNNDMDKVFKKIMATTGDRVLGLINSTDPQQIPLEMSRLMLKRVRSFKVKTEMDTVKRRRLRQLHNKIK